MATLLIWQDASPAAIAHPDIACWKTAPLAGSTSGYTVYDTRHDEQPFRMTHNRDQIRNGREIEQDYNFIDYWFGDPTNPLQARYYLKEDEVFVTLPGKEPSSIERARAVFPAGVLCYLQKRFSRIEVATETGYVELWPSAK